MPIASALLSVVLAGAQAGTVEVPFHKGENAIIVDALVNGRKLSFMFDTGFGGALVVDSNINLGPASGNMILRDFVGQFEAKTVKLKSLKLGGKDIESAEMEAVMQPADYSFSYNTHCDGIMGFAVIQNYVTEINMEKNKFIFHPKSVDISKRTPDNKKTFLLKMLPMGTNSIELDVKAPNGKRLHLALDTGNAFYATTHKDVLERVGLWPENKKAKFMKSSFVASGAVDSWTKKMEDMTIFGVPVKTSYWDIIDLPSSSAEGDGTVGFGFLKNFNIIIDYDRRRVWLENFTGRVRVFRVAPESPAEKAGVKTGDELLSVDGTPMGKELGYREIEALLDGEVGSKVKLSISRGGALQRLEIERAHLINE
jgi:predicted aspartyl protease